MPVYNLLNNQFHDKAVALDIKGRHAPFLALLIISEMRVRGCNPFASVTPLVPETVRWQD